MVAISCVAGFVQTIFFDQRYSKSIRLQLLSNKKKIWCINKDMEKKGQGREQFVPPKPLYVESDTTGEARPPVLEYLARHYRSQYDLEKIKVYNNHAMDTCYNLPWEDVTEHFEVRSEVPSAPEVVSSLEKGVQNASNDIQSAITPSGLVLQNIYDITNTKNSNSTTNLNKVGSISFKNGGKLSRLPKQHVFSGSNNGSNPVKVQFPKKGSSALQSGDTILLEKNSLGNNTFWIYLPKQNGSSIYIVNQNISEIPLAMDPSNCSADYNYCSSTGLYYCCDNSKCQGQSAGGCSGLANCTCPGVLLYTNGSLNKSLSKQVNNLFLNNVNAVNLVCAGNTWYLVGSSLSSVSSIRFENDANIKSYNKGINFNFPDGGPGGDGPMIKFNTHSGDLVDFVLGGDGQLRKYWFYNSKNQGEANSDLGSFFTGQP